MRQDLEHCGAAEYGGRLPLPALYGKAAAGEEGAGEGMRENLKKARKDAGMTQQEVADKLGIGIGYYQKIEAGERTGNFTLWDALEDILGIHQRILREISSNHPDPKANP